RTFDPVGERRFDREIPLAGESEKAHGEVRVVGGERGIDLARRNRGVERVRDRVIGERRRIVLGSEQELRLEGARRGGPRGEREGNGERKWHSDTRRGHRIVLLRPPPQFRQARWRRQGTTAKNCRSGMAGGGTQGPSRSSEKPRSVRRLGRLA